MNTNILSKNKEIVMQIDEIHDRTGYKEKFITKKSGIPESTFYQKRKQSFSVDEVEQTVSLIN
jgi:hypothetical protein